LERGRVPPAENITAADTGCRRDREAAHARERRREGLGGRDRRAAGAAERARVNVTRAISDGVKRIREHSRALARHLDASVRTGVFCRYQPPDVTAIRWET